MSEKAGREKTEGEETECAAGSKDVEMSTAESNNDGVQGGLLVNADSKENGPQDNPTAVEDSNDKGNNPPEVVDESQPVIVPLESPHSEHESMTVEKSTDTDKASDSDSENSPQDNPTAVEGSIPNDEGNKPPEVVDESQPDTVPLESPHSEHERMTVDLVDNDKPTDTDTASDNDSEINWESAEDRDDKEDVEKDAGLNSDEEESKIATSSEGASKKRKKSAGKANSASKKDKGAVKGARKTKQPTLSEIMNRGPSMAQASSVPRLRSRWSSRDTDNYLQGYPGKKDNPGQRQNLLFYTNQIPSQPNGDFVDNIHLTWLGEYDLLEMHHGYIQWLFPIREEGMNWDAQPLQLHEAKAICDDKEAHTRVQRSYELMLDFYGMQLADKKTGEIKRSKKWRSRYAHLNRSMHNYLRITRILKCLGELGYNHFQAPFVSFCIREAFENRVLTGIQRSLSDYWVHVVKDDEQREALIREIERLS